MDAGAGSRVPGPELTGLDALLGTQVEEMTPTRVVLRLTIDERHLQPLGLVHGGVFAAIAETAASTGAWLNARAKDPGLGVVGLENHTSFLRAGRVGAEVVAEATPRHAGRRTQSWGVTFRDAASGRELAVSTVRLLVIRPEEV
jgi:uncharacterized protein (TIGR00369 family)